MLYQLPNGKVVHLTVEEYLELTDLDIQYLMSLDYGNYIIDPFSGSAVETTNNKSYDFDFVVSDDLDNYDNMPSDDLPFDDIIDLANNLDN